MSELRTLKDLYGVYPNENDNKHIDEAELKAEAVKRAKHFKNKIENSENIVIENYFCGRLDEVIEANNLTEDDLK